MSETLSPAAYQPSQPLEHQELLIVLGKNIGIGSSPEAIQQRHDHLSQESRLNALAAGELWRPGTDILFSSGPTAGPDVPAEAAAMKDYFVAHYPHIPKSNVLTEEESRNTVGNATEVAKLLTDQHYRYIGLVTVGYHLKRAAKLFGQAGVAVNVKYASEDVVENINGHYTSYVNRWRKSPRALAGRVKESISRTALHANPSLAKKISNDITKKSRG